MPNYFDSIFYKELTVNYTDVVTDRLLGNTQNIRYLLIAMRVYQKSEHITFPICKRIEMHQKLIVMHRTLVNVFNKRLRNCGIDLQDAAFYGPY